MQLPGKPRGDNKMNHGNINRQIYHHQMEQEEIAKGTRIPQQGQIPTRNMETPNQGTKESPKQGEITNGKQGNMETRVDNKRNEGYNTTRGDNKTEIPKAKLQLYNA